MQHLDGAQITLTRMAVKGSAMATLAAMKLCNRIA